MEKNPFRNIVWKTTLRLRDHGDPQNSTAFVAQEIKENWKFYFNQIIETAFILLLINFFR